MPRGRPKKNAKLDLSPAVAPEVAPVVETKSDAVTEVLDNTPKAEVVKERTDSTKNPLTPIEDSRLALKQPLGEGQQYFESPEGFIVVGEKNRGRVWCRQANLGSGMWINPMR
jgi:hypothetical protein